MAQGKCIYCGETIEINQNDVSICNSCSCENINEKAVEFFEVPDEITKSIKGIREELNKAVLENDINKIQSFSREIKDIISNDVRANYYFSYAKKMGENQYFLNKFLLETNRDNITTCEANEIVLHLIKHFAKTEKKKILDFIKRIALSAEEQMNWRDALDEAIETVDEVKSETPTVYVCYDMENYKIAKILLEAINISGYQTINNDENLIKVSQANVFVVISSINSMRNNDVREKIVTASNANKPMIEFKADESDHDAFFNDFFGIDEYIMGFINFNEAVAELVQAIADEINGVDDETKTLKLNLRRQSNKAVLEEKAKIKREQEEKERKRLEEERLEKERIEAEERKVREEQARLARVEAERIAKEKEESERLNRMERMILDSYTPSRMIKSETTKAIDISKIILKVEKLIEAGEDLIALDICEDLTERYPGDYRVWFLFVKLLTSNFTYLADNSHIKYMDRALELANSIQKQEILKQYLPFSKQKEKLNVYRSLSYALYRRINDIPQGIRLCNEGIKAYREGDIKKAVKYWILGSKSGNAEAQYCLAVQYVSGRYIEQNTSKAMGLFISAANKGHDKSIMTLADAYEKGLFGIEKDQEASIYYYKKMLKKGNKDVIKNIMRLGDIYEKSGYKIPANRVVALKYFEAAAEEGNEEAILKCASLHCYGIGNIYDRAKGANYYRIGAEMGIEYAMVRYAEIVKNGLYDTQKNPQLYVDIITKLANTYLENEAYQAEYINLFKHGTNGVKKNYDTVLKRYEELAIKAPNVVKYQLKLAEIYEKGLYGANIDPAKVVNIYYTLSQKHPENEECQIKMAEIYEKGLYGVAKNINTVGQIYALLTKNYPDNPVYLVKLAELFRISSGDNAFPKSLDYYQQAYKLNDFKASCMLVLMYFEGDDRTRYRDYNRALEIRDKIKDEYANKLLIGEEKELYIKTEIAEMKIYANGGYGVQKNLEVAKKLLVAYNDKTNEKLKFKDLEIA